MSSRVLCMWHALLAVILSWFGSAAHAKSDSEHDGVAEREQERMRGVFGVCTLNRDVKECNKRAAMQ